MVNNIEKMVIIEKAGDIIQVVLPIFAYIKYEGFIKNFLLANILCHSLKLTIKRVRPNGRSTTSFPSGHTVATFFSYFFIKKNMKSENTFTIFFLPVLTVFVGFSRIYCKKHYFSDVIAGILIAFICS